MRVVVVVVMMMVMVIFSLRCVPFKTECPFLETTCLKSWPCSLLPQRWAWLWW